MFTTHQINQIKPHDVLREGVPTKTHKKFETKPLKNNPNNRKLLNAKIPKINMKKCMNLENKCKRRGIRDLPALGERDFAKDSEENDKNPKKSSDRLVGRKRL